HRLDAVVERLLELRIAPGLQRLAMAVEFRLGADFPRALEYEARGLVVEVDRLQVLRRRVERDARAGEVGLLVDLDRFRLRRAARAGERRDDALHGCGFHVDVLLVAPFDAQTGRVVRFRRDNAGSRYT